MDKLAISRLLNVVLSLSLIVALVFVGRGYWRNWAWQQEVYPFAGCFGDSRAKDDFKNGKRRLFQLDGEQQDDVFTGQFEGPFEVWHPQYFPSLGYPHRCATEEWVAAYNRKMRYMQAHPEEFSAAAEPQAVGDHPKHDNTVLDRDHRMAEQ